MRRANVGNLMGIKSVMLLVLACVLLCGTGPALAQSVNLADLEFQDLNIEFRNNGIADGWQAISVPAILAASDNADYSSLGGDLFINGRINTGDEQLSAQNNAKLFSQGQAGDPNAKWVMPRPLLANGSAGQPLQLVTIIKNVPTEFIDGLRDGSIPSGANAIVDAVTADFSRSLFAEGTLPSVYSNVHPNFVTSVVDISSTLFSDPSDIANAEASMVLVLWSSPDLVISATDFDDGRKGLAGQSFSAVVAIDKGTLAKHQKRSNFIGIETGFSSQPQFLRIGGFQPSAPQPNAVDGKVGEGFGIKVVDSPNVFTFDGLFDATNNVDDFISAIPATDPVPFQFRQGDTVWVDLQIDEKASLDGEPDEYFGVNSDEIVDVTLDGRIVKVVDGTQVPTGAFLMFDTLLGGDIQRVVDPNSVEFSLLGAGPSSSKVVRVEGKVRDDVAAANALITSGSFRIFVLNAAIVDEIKSVDTTRAHHYADSAGPLVTDLKMVNELQGVSGGDISLDPAADQASVYVQIDGNGEPITSDASLKRWLNIFVDQTWVLADGVTEFDPNDPNALRWFDPTLAGLPKPVPLGIRQPTAVTETSLPISAAFRATLIPAIPSNNPLILGASVTIRLQNNTTAYSMRSGGVVLNVFDDARNPALVYESYNPQTQQGINPRRNIDSTKDWFSLKIDPIPGGPVSSNKLGKTVVEVDNVPPRITSVDFSVIAPPVGFWNGIDSFSDAGQNIFNLLKKTFESEWLNGSQIAESARKIYRGTGAYHDGLRPYNGSPVQAIITFEPVDTSNPYAAEDSDGVVPAGANGLALVDSRFNFSLVNPTLGYTSTGPGVNLPAGHWDIVDATIAANGVGTAIFQDRSGVPDTLLAETKQGIQVTMYDVGSNSAALAGAPQVYFDNLSPQVYVHKTDTAPWNAVVDGRNLAPQTDLLIIDTGGKTIAELGFDPDTDPITDLTGPANENLKNLPAAGPARLEAGNMIVMRVRLRENNTGATATFSNSLFNVDGSGFRLAGFPFVFNTEDAGARGGSAADLLLDTAGTLYGQQFKTIAADFYSFVTDSSARDVLPDHVRIVDPPLGVGDARVGDEIEATWYYVVSPDATLNASIAPTAVRNVTFSARDLSGRKSSILVPAARAEFLQPLVTILNYEITVPARGITGAVIERADEYLDGVNDAAAFAISAATSNYNNSTVLLVAKIGDGVSRGGPFAPTNPIKADFTALGGGIVLPQLITDENGIPVTGGFGALAPDKILWATFVAGPFTNTAPGSNGLADKRVRVTAMASTLGVGYAETSPIQVDMVVPVVTVGPVEEKDQYGFPTAAFGDSPTDGVIRPGQTVSVTSEFNTDAADRANVNLVQWTPDLSQFGSGIVPMEFGIKVPPFNTIGITYTFQVPLTVETRFSRAIVSAKDAAGNTGTGQSPFVTINASVPTVNQTILSASSAVNFATNAVRPTYEMVEVGRRVVNVPDILNPAYEPTSWAMAKEGSEILVQAVISINDPAFSTLNLEANFSDFSGPDYASVVPSTTPTVAGNIIHATWFHRVQASGGSVQNASVSIYAANPAGVVASGTVTQTVAMTVDKVAPVVKGELKYYAGPDHQPFTGTLLNPNQEFAWTPPETGGTQIVPVTASVVLTAEWTDASDEYGYLDGIVAALLKDGQPFDQALPVLFRLNDADGILANAPQPTFWSFTDTEGVITDQGSATDGPIVTSASFPDQAAIAEDLIKKGTHSVLNVWYGMDPRTGLGNNSMALKKNVAVNNARLIFDAQDVIGNKTSYVLEPKVTMDGAAPVIASRFIGAVTLDVAADQEPWADYIPAIFADGTIVRPTRVAGGTKLNANFWIVDAPNPDAPLTVGLVGSDAARSLKATNWDVLSPAEEAIAGTFALAKGDKSPNPYAVGAVVDPSLVEGDPVFVSVDFTLDGGVTTFPYNTSSVANALSPANYDTTNPANLSSIIVDATDQVGNKVQGVRAWSGVEVDTQGPGLIHQTFVLAGDLDQVNALNGAPAAIPQGQAVSARAGQWIIWCATFVVDGVEDEHFPLDTFDFNWSGAFEFDVDRLVPNSNVKGKKYFVQSATRSIIFVTNAVQVRSDADPRDATQLKGVAFDFFGNKTEITTPFIGISAGGPIATEIALTVDGKSQTVVGSSQLGIGGQGPDIRSTAFEVYPGATLIVEATITPIAGRAPDTILLNASDLYPTGMKPLVDELIPTEQYMTPSGTIYAKWESVTWDFSGVTKAPFPAAANMDAQAASQWFFDKSSLNAILGQNLTFNGPIPGAVPTALIGLGSLGNNNVVGASGRGGAYTYLRDGDNAWLPTVSLENALNALIGLPAITVQPNALAKQIAWVTVTVEDSASLFAVERNYSTFFTVDTRPPRASYAYNVESRVLPPTVVDSKGFPAAVNTAALRPGTLPRVRGGDAVAVIVEVTNSTIDKRANDLFRPLPGLFPETLEGAFFAIQAGNSASIRDVTADLSQLSSAEGMENVSAAAAPNEIVITSRGENRPDKIQATYHVQITPDKGNTVVTSNTAREIVPTVVDDAGNAPRNTVYTNQTLRSMTPMAIDNTPPSISGNVEVVLLEGEATTPANVQLGPGAVIPAGSVIAPGALLSVTVQITDVVDHPLDLVNSLNYGDVALRTQGLVVDPANILLLRENARLSGGSDSIRVPYSVRVPSSELGKSTFAFQFIIQATDTIGNTASRVSIESFAFDANPDVTFADAGGNVLPEPVVVFANAGVPFILSANALDVGGIKTVQWTAATESEGVDITAVDEDGTEHEDLLWNLDPARQRARLDLVVNAPVSAGAVDPVLAKLLAVDVDDNVNLNAEETVVININQPPIIADALNLTEINDAGLVTVTELTAPEEGVGYNTAFGDVREITIAEGSVMNLDIVATDANGDPIVFSATGSAVTSENVVGTLTDNGDGTGVFQFVPGYLAVVGDDDMETFELDLLAEGTHGIAPDTMKLMINVTAKSATPVITVISASVNDVEVPTDREQIQVVEGDTLRMLVRGEDPGKETVLTMEIVTNPEGVVFNQTITQVEDGIVEGEIVYTPGPTDADVVLVGYDSPIDPFVFQFQVRNASAEAELLRTIDIVNKSQAPLVQTMVSVSGGTPVALVDGGSVIANPGDTVVFNIKATDPDGDAVQFPQDPVVVAGAGFTSAFQVTNLQPNFTESVLTIGIPAEVAPEDTLVTITYTAIDLTGQARTVQYTIQVQVGPAVPTVDELLIAQGDGGNTTVNYRNLDPSVTEIDGKPVAITSVYRSFYGSAGSFAERNGGGLGRATYVTNGDINGDGLVDTLVTVGPVKAGAGIEFDYPNIVIPRQAEFGNAVIGHSFMAFPVGTEDLAVNYRGGEVRAVMGNFIGQSPAQIAVAQGFGGNHVVRIYQYTGLPAPHGYSVVAQFTGLVAAAQTNNANGGMVLAAGDLNNDGKDELVIGQTNSATSRTQFQSVSFNEDGSIASRAAGVAFPRRFQGNGGVEMVVTDLDGNGLNEIVFASAGNTRDFTENEDGRNTAPLSLLTVMIPQLDTQGNVSSFVRATGIPVIKVFNDETNPSGAMSVTALEADGNAANGKELVVGTGAVYQIDGYDITAINPAPVAKYSIIKLGFDGENITGLTAVTGIGGQPAVGRNAFPADLNPTSGAIFVSGGNTDGPGSGSSTTPAE